MVLADSRRVPRVPRYLGLPLGHSQISPTRLSRSLARLSSLFGYLAVVLNAAPLPRSHSRDPGLGSSGFARHYFRNRVFFIFLQVLRCFTSLGLPPLPYVFRQG